MNALSIPSTDDTPKVIFDPNTNTLEISGRSLPEDAISFYTPVVEWLKEHMQKSKDGSNYTFHFEYISTSSTKQIMKLFLMINEQAKTKNPNVVWKYDKDDDDMKQTGIRLQKLTSIEFSYVEV